jgi:hypothetical protein
MTRAHLASAALVALTMLGSTGCGGRYHHARYRYGYVARFQVVPVAVEAPVAYEPPPAPPPRPSPRIMHVTSPHLAPGTTVIIVNPTPAQVRAARGAPVAPVAPPSHDEPQDEAPPPPPQQAPQQGDPSWFDGE